MYSAIGQSVTVFNYGSTNTASAVHSGTVQNAGFIEGLAVGPVFAFTSSVNPTMWASYGAGLYYYDGSGFAYTNHFAPHMLQGIGASKNYLYGISTYTDGTKVTRYNGTANPTLVTTFTNMVFGSGVVADIVGDDADNFYLMDLVASPGVTVYSSSGVPVCSYSITGAPANTLATAFAIRDNMVSLYTFTTGYYVGLISGSTISFSQAANFSPNQYGAADFASCSIPTVFPTYISSAQGSSLTCIHPTLTLALNSTLAVASASWVGPGIVSVSAGNTIQVNAAGVYTCFVVGATCPVKTSISTYTITNAIFPITVSINPSSTLSCSEETVSLQASGALNYSWSPAAGLNTTNGSGVYASPLVSTNYTVMGTTGICTHSAVVNLSVNPTPTLVNLSGSPTVCAGSPSTLSLSGATLYNWLPGNMTSSVTIVNPLVSTIYTISGTVDNCSAVIQITVTANPLPILNPVANPPALCLGSSATLNASDAVTYTWQPGNVFTTSLSVTPSATQIYTVTGINVFGCSSQSILNLVVTPYPTLVISPPSPTFCYGAVSTLSVNGAASYTWSQGLQSGSSATFNPSSNTTYTVSGSTNNCANTTTVFVSVIPSPSLISVSSSNTLCSGSALTVSATGAVSYTWQPGVLTGSMQLFNPALSATYSVTGIAANGCVGTNTLAVTVYFLPLVTAISSSGTICIGATATLSASGAFAYSWTPVSQNGSSISVSPTSQTAYTVTGTSADGCKSSTTLSLEVSQFPTLTVVPSSTSVCAFDLVNLSASGANTYSWAPGSHQGQTLSVTPSVTTTFTVIGFNLAGCTSTTTASINVNPQPVISTIASATSICENGLSTLSASGADSYTWQPGNSVSSTITVSPPVTTQYSVAASFSTTGCSSFTTITLSVLPNPTLQVLASPSVICSGQSSSLLATRATNFTWSSGNSSAASNIVQPAISTIYTVVGSLGSCSDTQTVMIQVNSNPVLLVNGTTASSLQICDGQVLTLLASGATNYTWQPSDLVSTNYTTVATASSVYTLNGSLSTGCQSSFVLQVTLLSLPSVSVNSTRTIICKGEIIELQAFCADTYTWNGTTAGTTFTAIPVNSGNYNFYISSTGANGCESYPMYTAVFVQECTGLKEPALQKSGITIYPNPTSSELTIRSNSFSETTSLNFYSSTGQLILIIEEVWGGIKIDLNNFQKGFYTLVVKERNTIMHVQKIIKE